MGIPGLWDVLGEGEVRHIADYASDHFKKHGRPLRIAVDEATWRFTNLTDEQVARIREGEPAANPIEKTILWRILRLWRLNIQLLFVWDGMKKPGKGRFKGPGGGKVDDAVIKLLHRMFDMLQVPYHRAPGEAEAECARLQQLGIVDAVWSDDGDSFMFGCTTLIKQHKVKQKAVKDHVRIYQASVDLGRLELDAESLVIFALCSGGDYDRQGLKNCGPTTAKAISKRKYGLAQALAKVVTERDLPAWRETLKSVLRACRKDVEVPSNFPTWKVLEGYRHPAISTDEKHHNLRGLRGGWERTIDEAKLRVELRERYHFTTREYLKHVAPAMLVRKLVNASTPQKKQENLTYEVQMKRTRKQKAADGEDAPAKSEAKIWFAAALLVSIDLTVRPLEEDWTNFAAKDGTPYDPLQRIETEILSCFLSYGLPEGSYETPPSPKKRKRKSDHEAEASSQDTNGATDRASQPQKGSQDDSQVSTTTGSSSKKRKAAESNDAKPKKPTKIPKNAPEEAGRGKKKQRKSKDSEKTPPSPPPSQFKHLDISEFDLTPTVATPIKRAKVIDLCDEDEGVNDKGLFISPASSAPALSRSRHQQRLSHDTEFIEPLIASTAGMTVPTLPSTLVANTLRQPAFAAPRPEKVPCSAPGIDKPRIVSAQHDSASTPSPSKLAAPKPGEAIDLVKLRERRLAALLNRGPPDAEVPKPTQPLRNHRPIQASEIIDLT